MAIELLEQRIAPAGVIDVIVKNGALTLKTLPNGDGAESLSVRNGPNAGEYDLIVAPGTKLRVNGVELGDGQDYIVQGVTGLISVSLGAGDDTISFSSAKLPGGLNVDLGEGKNFFSISGGTVGSFSYKGGAGNDWVYLHSATVAGSVTVDAGSGYNQYGIGRILVAGDMVLKGGSGRDEITSSGTIASRIAGKFTATLGDGENFMNLAGALAVGRDVSITTGKGNDILYFACSDVIVGGNLAVNTGAGKDSTAFDLSSVLQVAKNFTLTSTGAPGETILQHVEAIHDVNVGGNLMLKSGTAATITQKVLSSLQDIAVAGAVSVSAGLGVATQTINADVLLSVGKGITLSALGGGTQSISTSVNGGIGGSSITGPVNISGGTGVFLGINGDVRGAVNITTGKSALQGGAQIGGFDAASVLRIHGPLKVKLNSVAGGEAQGVVLVNTVLSHTATLQGSVGADQFIFEEVLAMGAVKIDGGAGNDDLLVEKGTPLVGRTNFLHTFTFKGGAGDDEVQWGGDAGGAHEVFAAKQVTIDGGTGANTFTAGTGAIFFAPLKKLALA